MASKRLASELARFRAMPPSVENTGAGGGTYRSRYYGPGGGFMLSQNQPGVSDFGQDAGGRYTTTNIHAGGTPIPLPGTGHNTRAQNDNSVETGYSTASMLQQFAKMLQANYPQYTNHAHFEEKNLPNGIAGLGGGGIWQVDPKQMGDNPQFGRTTVAKELGQAVMDRMVPNTPSGDALMALWGHPGRHMDYVNWTPQTLPSIMKSPQSIDVGGYHTFPTDAYGMGFAGALGETDPGIKQGTHSLLTGPKLAYAQARGYLPTAVDNSTRAQLLAMAQRNAQQNKANAAMRGGARNF